MEWSLLPRVFEGICSVFGHPHLYFFATRVNTKVSLYESPALDPMAWKNDAFQHPWDHLSTHAFSPFALLRKVLFKVLTSAGILLILVALLWPQEWFTNLLSLLVNESLDLLQLWNLLVQLHMWKLHQGLGTLRFHVCRLSGVLSERRAFQGRLCKSQL